MLRVGYSPIPLYGKEPPVYGKNNPRKGLAGWQKLGDISYEQIELWAKTWPDAVNTGVLTQLVPALDLDILNEEAAVAAEENVREPGADWPGAEAGDFISYGRTVREDRRQPDRAKR